MVGIATMDDDSYEYDLDEDLNAVSGLLKMDSSKIQMCFCIDNSLCFCIDYDAIR
jgi:hypothetical protein